VTIRHTDGLPAREVEEVAWNMLGELRDAEYVHRPSRTARRAAMFEKIAPCHRERDVRYTVDDGEGRQQQNLDDARTESQAKSVALGTARGELSAVPFLQVREAMLPRAIVGIATGIVLDLQCYQVYLPFRHRPRPVGPRSMLPIMVRRGKLRCNFFD